MKFSISQKENVSFKNRKCTSYKIEEYREDKFGQGAWYHVGRGFAKGHFASDDECISDYLDRDS